MRFYYFVLLAAAALLVSTDAMSTSSKPNAMKITAVDGNDSTTKRFLRKRSAAGEGDEEHGGFKDIADKVLSKAIKWKNYNKWIFGNKSPEWVKENHPEFAKGYEEFWENRMVHGGKYN